jgi:hypothetical protein
MLLAALALPPVGPARAQQPAAEPPLAANQPPVPYSPTMGDLMNTLVQPRHAKLGLAGQAQNWALAAYALREIRQATAAISKTIPRWRGYPVPDLFEAALGEPISTLQSAIQQQEPEKFKAAYTALTQGCNACHATTNHAFVVIKPPDASAFPNQDFGGRR